MSETSEKDRGLVRLVVVSGGAEVFGGNLDDLIKRDLMGKKKSRWRQSYQIVGARIQRCNDQWISQSVYCKMMQKLSKLRWLSTK